LIRNPDVFTWSVNFITWNNKQLQQLVLRSLSYRFEEKSYVATFPKYAGLPIPAHVSLPTIMPPVIINLQNMTSAASSPLAWQHLLVRRTSSRGSTLELNIRKCQNKLYSLQPFWAVGANNPVFSMSKISSRNRD
jgi:hypothetical protein